MTLVFMITAEGPVHAGLGGKSGAVVSESIAASRPTRSKARTRSLRHVYMMAGRRGEHGHYETAGFDAEQANEGETSRQRRQIEGYGLMQAGR